MLETAAILLKSVVVGLGIYKFLEGSPYYGSPDAGA
jgi:hypothetical protein